MLSKRQARTNSLDKHVSHNNKHIKYQVCDYSFSETILIKPQNVSNSDTDQRYSQGKICLTQLSTRNRSLAVSDLCHTFIQSIKFNTFHYQILKIVQMFKKSDSISKKKVNTFYGGPEVQLCSTNQNFFLQITNFLSNIATFLYKAQLLFLQY